jgi:hypothetical protein
MSHRNRGLSPLGKMQWQPAKTGVRKSVRSGFLADELQAPVVGRGSDLSSQVHTRASVSVPATDSAPTTSFLGYAVIAALVVGAVYAITQA